MVHGKPEALIVYGFGMHSTAYLIACFAVLIITILGTIIDHIATTMITLQNIIPAKSTEEKSIEHISKTILKRVHTANQIT